jgi:protease-4
LDGKSAVFLTFVVFMGLSLLLFTGLAALTPLKLTECVGVVSVEGEIGAESSGGGLFSTPTSFLQSFENAESNPEIKSILLYVNSPGGDAVASEEIYSAIMNSSKPVVAYLGSEAASGGYYVASATDYIIANQHTLTGSIGARFSFLNYAGLLEKLGLNESSIKSGALKDIGAPYRNMTPEEQGLLQSMISETAKGFADDVRKGRGSKLNEQKFEKILDARILGAREALDIGLIDQIGGRTDAVRKAAELGGLKGEPRLCSDYDSQSFSTLFSEGAKSFLKSVLGITTPRATMQFE